MGRSAVLHSFTALNPSKRQHGKLKEGTLKFTDETTVAAFEKSFREQFNLNTIISVTHDQGFARKSHRILEMVDGRIVS